MSSPANTRSRPARVEVGESPYPGPRPFSADEQHLFFGRRNEVYELASLVRAQRTVLIHAQSGAGKTSLVEAGLRPELEKRGCLVYPTARVRGASREGPEGTSTNRYVHNVIVSLAGQPGLAGEEASTLSELFGAGGADDQGPAARLRVVIFDQFEELFTFYPDRWADREGFFRQVHDSVDRDPLLRFLFLLRDDYLARLEPYAGLLSDELRTRYPLERLRRDAALEAITQPAAATTRAFEEAAAEALVDDLLAIPIEGARDRPVLGEFVEPVELQAVCRDLWERLPPDVTTVTVEDVRQYARIAEVLGRFYDDAVTDAARRGHVKERQVRLWFERSLITPSRTRGILYRDETRTGTLRNEAVDALEQRRVIRSEQRGGSQWYELTHDRLVQAVLDSNRVWFAGRRTRKRRWLLGSGVALGVLLLVAGLLVFRSHHGPPGLDDFAYDNSFTEPGQVARNQFQAVKGTEVILSLIASPISPRDQTDATLRLLAPDHRVVGESPADDIPGARLTSELPTTGLYTVEVTATVPGTYTLTGERMGKVRPAVIASETSVDGRIDSQAQVDVFRLEQDRPGLATIKGGPQTRLRLLRLDGTVVGDNNNTALGVGNVANPSVVAFLPGKYRIEVGARYDLFTLRQRGLGSYHLDISFHDQAVPIEPGFFDRPSGSDVFSLRGGVGTAAVLQSLVKQCCVQSVSVYRPDGTSLPISPSHSSPGAYVWSFGIDREGTYVIAVTSRVPYRLTYTRIGPSG